MTALRRHSSRMLRPSLLALLLVVGCGDDDGAGVDAAAAEDAATPDSSSSDSAVDMDAGDPPPLEVGGDRPARVIVPASYDPEVPAPLLILLHGYSANAQAQDLYFGLRQKTRARGMLLVLPDGTVDGVGNQFWNATPACCDFGATGVDDVAYITGLINEMKSFYNVDAGRVYLMGHSNGGFMSYRMACDAADEITAIASLAGSTFMDATRCEPSRPISVLQIHGTRDATIAYGGVAGRFPPAQDTVARFAMRAGCTASETSAPLDVDSSIDGEETTVDVWSGCNDGLSAELWSIQEGVHIPPLQRTATDGILDWLLSHSF